jgi:hypothetical protein
LQIPEHREPHSVDQRHLPKAVDLISELTEAEPRQLVPGCSDFFGEWASECDSFSTLSS